MDDATGNVVNPNLRDYKIATSLDIPEITPIFVDVVDRSSTTWASRPRRAGRVRARRPSPTPSTTRSGCTSARSR